MANRYVSNLPDPLFIGENFDNNQFKAVGSLYRAQRVPLVGEASDDIFLRDIAEPAGAQRMQDFRIVDAPAIPADQMGNWLNANDREDFLRSTGLKQAQLAQYKTNLALTRPKTYLALKNREFNRIISSLESVYQAARGSQLGYGLTDESAKEFARAAISPLTEVFITSFAQQFPADAAAIDKLYRVGVGANRL